MMREREKWALVLLFIYSRFGLLFLVPCRFDPTHTQHTKEYVNRFPVLLRVLLAV
jgi:hypothetical protein